MKILYVGESWYGSNARSLGDALARQPDTQFESVGVDLLVPRHNGPALRGANRLLRPFQIRELEDQIERACLDFEPDVIVVVKGWHFGPKYIRRLRETYAPVVNIFPDASPHAHGDRLKAAMGEYNLVICRHRQHPAVWKSLYGYDNVARHVTHGYCPKLHYRAAPSVDQPFDVVMVATGRSEYAELLRGVARRLSKQSLTVAVAGNGWDKWGFSSEAAISFVGVKPGAAYTEWLRKGKIVIAPVQTVVTVNGVSQTGDEITARTFQCAASNSFFIHRRSEEISLYYDEDSEVPLYNDAEELADKVGHYLGHHEERREMAAAAHARAVPAYSFDARAREITDHIRAELFAVPD